MDENFPMDTDIVNSLTLAGIAGHLSTALNHLEVVQQMIQARPDAMEINNGFDLNAAIVEFVERTTAIRKSELKRILDANPSLREEFEAEGLDPDAI